MDARQYASKNVRPDNVREAPIQARIVNVFIEDRYGRLCLELETGAEFPLNDGNNNALIKAWGHDTDGWIGLEVEFYLGTLERLARRSAGGKRNCWCAPSRRQKQLRKTAARRQPSLRCRRAGQPRQAEPTATWTTISRSELTVCRHARSWSKQKKDRATVSHAGHQ